MTSTSTASSYATPGSVGASSVEAVRALRQCFGQFATGVTVVTFAGRSGRHGLTVNSFTSVSLTPALVLVCLDNKSRAENELGDQPFAVNILSAKQEWIAWHFAGKRRIDHIPWQTRHDIPAIDGAMTRLWCRAYSRIEAGDHSIVLGEVFDFETEESDALIFFRGEMMSLEHVKSAANDFGEHDHETQAERAHRPSDDVS